MGLISVCTYTDSCCYKEILRTLSLKNFSYVKQESSIGKKRIRKYWGILTSHLKSGISTARRAQPIGSLAPVHALVRVPPGVRGAQEEEPARRQQHAARPAHAARAQRKPVLEPAHRGRRVALCAALERGRLMARHHGILGLFHQLGRERGVPWRQG